MPSKRDSELWYLSVEMSEQVNFLVAENTRELSLAGIHSRKSKGAEFLLLINIRT